MGVWDYISGAADSVKRNAPDLTSVKSWASSSYGYTKDGVTDFHNAVKVNAGDVLSRSQCWPSEETRSKILPFAVNVAKYSAQEGLKFVPGGVMASNVVKKALHDVNKSGDHAMDVKELRATVDRLDKEVGHYKKLFEQMEMKNKQSFDFRPSKTPDMDSNFVVNQKPEDVIRVFMMKDFIGGQFLDDLLVPVAKPRKK